MKFIKVLLMIIVAGSAGICKAQYAHTTTNENRMSLTLGAGITTLYGDLETKRPRAAFRGNLDYNITPFISAGIEGQFGRLSEGDEDIHGVSEGLYMESNYSTVQANARLSAGQFMGEQEKTFNQLLGGIYIGSGVGFISNNVGTIIDTYGITKGPIKGTITIKTTELIVPVNIGINYNLPINGLALNLNYQYNMTMGENLDGYNFTVNNNKKNDVYSFLSFAIRYYFGGSRSYY